MHFARRLRELGQDVRILDRGPDALEMWVRVRTDLTSEQRQRLLVAWSRSVAEDDRSFFRVACDEIAEELDAA